MAIGLVNKRRDKIMYYCSKCYRQIDSYEYYKNDGYCDICIHLIKWNGKNIKLRKVYKY